MARFQRTLLAACLGVASLLGCNDSPYSGRQRVDLSGKQVSETDLRRLVPSDRVTELYVKGTGLGDSAMDHVARCIHLEALDLTATNVTDAGIAKIAELPRLQILVMDHTAVSDAGLHSLAQCQSLEQLFAMNTNVTETGITQLQRAIPGLHVEWSTARSEELRRACVRLQELGISATTRNEALPTRPEWAYYSACIGALPNAATEEVGRLLRIVCEAGGTKILLQKGSGRDISYLGHLRESASPQDLYLLSAELRDEDLDVLRPMDSLRGLLVSSPHITDAGLATISEVSSLESLAVESASISREGLKHLQKLKRLKQLTVFVRSVGSEEIEALAGIPSLQEATIKCENQLTEQEIARLQTLCAARLRISPDSIPPDSGHEAK